MVEERPRKKQNVEGKERMKRMRSEWYRKLLKVNSAICYPRLSKTIKSVHCNTT